MISLNASYTTKSSERREAEAPRVNVRSSGGQLQTMPDPYRSVKARRNRKTRTSS